MAELSFGMSKKNGTKRQKMTLNLTQNQMEKLEGARRDKVYCFTYGPTASNPVNSTEFSSMQVRANVAAASMHVEKMNDVRRYVKKLLVPYRRSKVLRGDTGPCQNCILISLSRVGIKWLRK